LPCKPDEVIRQVFLFYFIDERQFCSDLKSFLSFQRFLYCFYYLVISFELNINYHRHYFMKNIFNPVYRQDYLDGFLSGLNPNMQIDVTKNEAYTFGFSEGRNEYEKMNGKVAYGIPQLIVTNKVLEEFLLAGMLGFDINSDGYTAFQIDVILKWYQSGVEKYNPNQSSYLLSILEEKGIELE